MTPATATRNRTARRSLIDEARVTGFIEPAETDEWLIEQVIADDPFSGSIGSAFRTGRGVVNRGETYTVLYKKWINEINGKPCKGIMMSDTPDELRDLLPVFHAPPKGSVLIMGLGLGCVVKALLTLDQVESIDIVEISKDLIDLVGPYYTTDDRVTIHHGNSFNIGWPANSYWDIVWHDIWGTISEDNLPDMTKLHRKYGSRCGWQGSWSKDFLLAHRNRY